MLSVLAAENDGASDDMMFFTVFRSRCAGAVRRRGAAARAGAR
jgi:hypothetical protein